MTSYPDFTSYGYTIQKELGHNRAGGRITHLALNQQTQQQVVIKEFQFAQGNSDWSAYDLVQSEVQVLKKLTHPAIPRYLDSFATPQGFCLVQEYKNAPSLAQGRYFSVTEVKQIAQALLRVLVYLQSHHPPIIHRDIKPENILVDRSSGKIQVYLIDFGFARLGGDDLAASSTVKGTLGFMPPEQIFNRQLTLASDLYSLGVTLTCLLTRTPSQQVGELMADNFRLDLKAKLPQLSKRFLLWLSKITAPNAKDRYQNAKDALHHLGSIELDFSQSRPSSLAIKIIAGIAAIFALQISSGFISLIIISITDILNITDSPEVAVETTPVSKPTILASPGVATSPNPTSPKSSQSSTQDRLKATQLYEQAQQELKLQNYSRALFFLERATDYDPNYFEAWSDRCWSLFNLDRFSEAVVSCEQALELKQRDKGAWLVYGRALHRTNQYAEAINAYDLALQIDPQYYWGWNNRSISLNKLERHAEALTSADRATQINAEISNAWYAKCWALRGLGRYSQAHQSCDRAIAITPNNYWYHYEKGRIFYLTQRYSKAIEYFDRAINYRDTDPWGWYYKARSLEALGRTREAQQAYRRVLALDPSFTQAQTRLNNL